MNSARRDAEVTSYVASRLTSLRRIAFLLCQDAQRTDDLVQGAVAQLYVHWGRVRAAEHTDAYVRMILVRQYLSEQRGSWARRVSLPGELPERAGDVCDHDAILDLRAALARLPDRQRATLVLRYHCDLTIDQAADVAARRAPSRARRPRPWRHYGGCSGRPGRIGWRCREMDESGVRALLERVAAETPPPRTDAVAGGCGTGRRVLRLRRWLAAGASGLAVATIVAVLASGALPLRTSRPAPVVRRSAAPPTPALAVPLPPGSDLNGVAATSARDAWAVGGSFLGPRAVPAYHALIVHWNGTSWRRMPLPGSVKDAALLGVAAVSARTAWAVGTISRAGHSTTVILQWNGTAWSRVPSPSPQGDWWLAGVTAVSAQDAWAVGWSIGQKQPLIVHWNGVSWKRVPTPPLAGGGGLWSVTANSAGNAWAVGDYGRIPQALIEHWNGTAWTVVPSQHFPGGSGLFAVTGITTRDAWAVGVRGENAGQQQPLAEHWNGYSWTLLPTPHVGKGGGLRSVSATSGGDVWVTGSFLVGLPTNHALVLRWNGATWRRVSIPLLGGMLNGVTFSESGGVWAVGSLQATVSFHWQDPGGS